MTPKNPFRSLKNYIMFAVVSTPGSRNFLERACRILNSAGNFTCAFLDGKRQTGPGTPGPQRKSL